MAKLVFKNSWEGSLKSFIVFSKFRCIFLVLLIATVGRSATAFAVDGTVDWDPRTELPQWTFVGKVTDDEIQKSHEVRAYMIHQLSYWKEFGLGNPPDIDQLIYISSYEGLGIADFLRKIHRENTDVVSYIEDQHRHFKSTQIYKGLSRLSKVLFSKANGTKKDASEDPTDLGERVFDYFVLARFGFSTQNVMKHLQRNTPMESLSKNPLIPLKDNAFYSRLLRYDIKDFVRPSSDRSGSVKKTDNDFFEAIELLAEGLSKELDSKKMMALLKESVALRRIVILPRMTQKPGDLEVSTLSDTQVSLHENGHNVTNFLSEGRLHRMVDEVMADYLAAAPLDNPKIGAFFVAASEKIADRLSESQDPEDLTMVSGLRKLAKMEALRDLSEPSTVDTLERFFFSSDNYDGGNPIRFLLWSLYANPSYRKALNGVLFSTISEFSALPTIVTTRTQISLSIRDLYRSFLRNATKNGILKKLKSENPEVPEKELARLAEIEAKEKLKTTEKAKMAEAGGRSFTVSHRPAVTSDYVIPEFLRILYKNAYAADPALAEEIRRSAERAMNSSSVVFTSPSGAPVIVFFRARLDRMNPVIRIRISSLVKTLETTRIELASIPNTPENVEIRKPKLRKYDAALESLLEFERTASFYRLFVPHPVLSTGSTILKPVAWLIPKSKESCESSLEKK